LSDRGDNYVQEFIITFGFLEGLWFRLGYSPEGTIVDAIAEVIKTINPDYSWVSIVFMVLSVIFFIITLSQAFEIGGGLGIFAIFLAFIGGILLNQIGFILLAVAILIGWISPDVG